jgi:hypothetical protein
LFDVIEKIIRYRKKGEKRLAQDEIEYFYSSLNIESEIKSMSIENLTDFPRIRKKTDQRTHRNDCFCAERTRRTLLTTGELTKLDYFRKAYFLLDKVERESITFSMDRQMKMGELREYLN